MGYYTIARRSVAFLATVCMAVAALSSPDSNRELLVGTKDGSLSLAIKAVKGLGRIEGKDRASGLYRVALNIGVQPNKARATLESSFGISVVTASHPERVNAGSIQSVADLVTYLKQVQEKNETRDEETKSKEGESDFWEAYLQWLQDHVNQDGILDTDALHRGYAERDKLPPFHFGSGRRPSPFGNWSYVGPVENVKPAGRWDTGPFNMAGRINSIAVDPANTQIMYAAAGQGGLWKTTNGGAHWTEISDAWKSLTTSAVTVDSSNPNIVYVGTGDYQWYGGAYAFGIMKSTDGGSTWTNYGAATFGQLCIDKILIAPNNHNVILAVAGRQGGTWSLPGGGSIYRSTDGGVTWSAPSSLPDLSFDDIDVSLPSAGIRTFWVIAQCNTGAPLYKSTDDGATWTEVTTPIDTNAHYSAELACSKVDAQTLYILDPNTYNATQTGSHIWKSTNGGASWVDVIGGFPVNESNWKQDGYDDYIQTSKVTVNGVTTDALYVGLISLALSVDGGTTWTDYGQVLQNDANIHCDQHCCLVDPTNPNSVFLGNDGGVYHAIYNPTTAAGTFSCLNGDIEVTAYYHVAIHPTDSGRIIGGDQDDSEPITWDSGLSTWFSPTTGDGSFCAFDPYDPDTTYVSSQNLDIYIRSGGAANAYKSLKYKWDGEGTAFIAPFVCGTKGNAISPLFAGTNHLWMYKGGVWTKDLGGQQLSNGVVRSIATCPSNTQILYTGGSDGKLWMTTSQGATGTWTEIDSGLPKAAILAINVSPTNPNSVLVAFTGTGHHNLWQCTNTAAASPIWTAITGSTTYPLPKLPTYCIARDPTDPDHTWYVGQEDGVVATTNAGQTWTNMTSPLGLPNVWVYDLELVNGTLYAGTYGRGMWRIAIAGTLQSVDIIPAAVIGGHGSTGVVHLNGTAGTGGVVVSLSSSNPAVTVAKTVTVPAGASQANFAIVTYAVSTQTDSTITAQTPVSVQSAVIGIMSAPLVSFSVNPTSVTGGNSVTGTVTLEGAAGPQGTVVALSSNSTDASPPKTVTVPAGKTSVTFQITTAKVTSTAQVTITAQLGNVSKPVTLTIIP